MSLYYDAASLIDSPNGNDSSLKLCVYGAKHLRSKPGQVYALLSETAKWNSVLKEVVEKSGVLSFERKLTPTLALLLAHDLLLSKGGVAAPAQHPLRLAVERNKARLNAELTKLRIKRGFSSLDAFRHAVNNEDESVLANGAAYHHPRWVRINRVKGSLAELRKTVFEGYREVKSLKEILDACGQREPPKLFHIDEHIPDLLALPTKIDLTNEPAYRNGEIILQDKASCFPAYLLEPWKYESVIDACSAPGNKTTHLAALMTSERDKPKLETNGVAENSAPIEPASPARTKNGTSSKPLIYACEKDKARATTLVKMVTTAGAANVVSVRAGQDFLKLDPTQPPWCSIQALLLDPSCSGSGIVGREAGAAFALPEAPTMITSGIGSGGGSSATRGSAPKRRKLSTSSSLTSSASTAAVRSAPDHPADPQPETGGAAPSAARLAALAAFQTRLLAHALSFPAARAVAYSTCSLHAQENEAVVAAALLSAAAAPPCSSLLSPMSSSASASPRAPPPHWELVPRAEQPAGLRAWPVRGEVAPFAEAAGEGGWSADEAGRLAEACLRCGKFDGRGTQGFFAAILRRRLGEGERDVGEDCEGGAEEEDDEWQGFE